MPIIAKKTGGGNFIPCPPGQFSAVCCDVVDLGVLEVSFGGKKKKQHKIYISWQVEEVMPDNRPFLISKRYTLSLHEKAALRKDLEAWRGRGFSEEELDGFDVESVIGAPCLINAVKNGEYTNVASIGRLHKSMTPLQVRDYVRVKDRPKTDEVQQQENQQWAEQYTDDDISF